MAYNVTVSGVEYDGIDKVQLPITGENKKATFYAGGVADFVVGNVTRFESDEIVGFDDTVLRAYAFYGCTKLESVSMPALVVSVTASVFSGCVALKSVNLPLTDGLMVSVFEGCSELESIVLPSVKTIGAKAFNNCAKLKKVDLPVVTSIAIQVFNNNAALEALILRASTVCALVNSNAFMGSGIASGTGYIYVPSALVDSYKADTNWSTYSDQFRAIEDYPDICG